MNMVKLKRMIRSNKLIGRTADKLYCYLTGQMKEEKHISDRTKTTYYIIRPPKADTGVFALYNLVLEKVIYAEEKGLKPVVDFKNYPTVYNRNSNKRNDNVWEWCFEQPDNNSLDEAYSSNYILARMMSFHDPSHFQDEILKGNIDYLKPYMKVAQSFDLSKDVKDYIRKYYSDFNGKGILGVSYRGTDYTQTKPIRHPVQPDVDDLIKLAREKMTEWGCDSIYLTTEEKKAVEKFKSAFPGKIITMDRELVENYDPNEGLLIERYKKAHGTDSYKSATEYLVSVYLLSQCDCFLGALCSSTIGALIMNNSQYINYEIINLGVYT